MTQYDSEAQDISTFRVYLLSIVAFYLGWSVWSVSCDFWGCPVLAFGKGGALETVIGAQGEDVPPGRATGVFFAEQSVDSITEAIGTFEAVEQQFSPRFIRTHAERFDKRQFRDKMSTFVAAKLEEYRALSELPRHKPSTAFNQPVF